MVALSGCAMTLNPAARAAETQVPENTRRIAVVYFSKTGNTRKVAETIRALTGADLYEVTTKEPYPEEYGPTTEIVKEEIEKGIEREIVAPKMDLSKYTFRAGMSSLAVILGIVTLGTTTSHRRCRPGSSPSISRERPSRTSTPTEAAAVCTRKRTS